MCKGTARSSIVALDRPRERAFACNGLADYPVLPVMDSKPMTNRLGRPVGFVPAAPKRNLQVIDTTLPWHPGMPWLPGLLVPYCTTELLRWPSPLRVFDGSGSTLVTRLASLI